MQASRGFSVKQQKNNELVFYCSISFKEFHVKDVFEQTLASNVTIDGISVVYCFQPPLLLPQSYPLLPSL